MNWSILDLLLLQKVGTSLIYLIRRYSRQLTKYMFYFLLLLLLLKHANICLTKSRTKIKMMDSTITMTKQEYKFGDNCSVIFYQDGNDGFNYYYIFEYVLHAFP